MNKFIKLIFLISLCMQLTYNKKFFFSVIISIYNAGRYLDDSIGSVLNQTIGKDKIQIILVNDGSTDETEEICLKYQNNYPKNIKYIKIEHRGVSVGRNVGLQYAKGKFINFLDADDKWDEQAFKLALLFFKYYKNLNMISCRIIFFEAQTSYHPLDYKFYKTRIVNLSQEYNCIQLSSSSSFFRHSAIKDKYFKEGIFNGEDTRFINSMLLLKPEYGLLKEAIYYYRKRSDSTSAIQNKFKDEDFYFYVFKSVDEYLIEESKKLYNKILPFIQFYIAYNTLFRIIIPSYYYLDKAKFNEYCKLIDNNLRQIEDKYIIEQKILSLNVKFLALSRKYQRDLRDEVKLINTKFIYSGHKLMNLKNDNNILIWRILDIKNGKIHLEGRDNFFLSRDRYFYFCKLGNNFFYPEYKDYSGYDSSTMFGMISKGRMVVFNIPIENKQKQILNFFLSYNGIDKEIYPSLGLFTHIPKALDGYYNSGDYIFKIIEGRITIFKYNINIELFFENLYCQQLNKINKTNLIELRSNYIQMKYEKKKTSAEIWIINDKLNRAGDNGEYFFRYLKRKRPKDIKYYFIINKNCLDYDRLKTLGNIVSFGSRKHLDLFIKSDKLISSVTKTSIINPFFNDYGYIKDLIHFDFIFIKDGIIKDDLSKYLNKIEKNINLIIVSSDEEYKSLLKDNYGYNYNNVILTGLPRYDNLKEFQNLTDKEKIVLILPTWRKFIKGTYDLNTYESKYLPTFNSSEFFNFYNNLINDDELLIKMVELNYRGIICLHPFFSEQSKDFKTNKIFSILKVCDYQNLILKSSLLVTDYSSVFFDFAYLKKPLIYVHFDYGLYRNYHYAQGYFDYSKHGFGIICYDLNCAINNIIFNLKNGCKLEQIYLKRINRFFKFIDDKNCERLYLSLLNNSYINIRENNQINEYIITFVILAILIKYIIREKIYNFFKYIVIY